MHQPEHTLVCCGVLRAPQRLVHLEKVRIFIIVAEVLPAHQVEDLCDPLCNSVYDPDHVQRVLKIIDDMAGFPILFRVSQRHFHHHTLGIVVVKRVLFYHVLLILLIGLECNLLQPDRAHIFER